MMETLKERICMMDTLHRLIFQNSRDMQGLEDGAVDLVVTSPPYPMIAMWDAQFAAQDGSVGLSLGREDGMAAFEGMHRLLDPVWHECFRVMKPGGFICINIGDATRTMGKEFALYPNHSRIQHTLMEAGFTPLPVILWRKQTNAPNKFMGSGTLPAGAYVTLEHEYILIARKGGKRVFSQPSGSAARRESALFWEERNLWFSDIWMDLKGVRQFMEKGGARERSAAFPFELPFRLISMYSVRGDTVLDPFMGLGTTLLAAMATARNSVGFELEPEFGDGIRSRVESLIPFAGELVDQRLARHRSFMEARIREKGAAKHRNVHYGFSVVAAQEKELLLTRPTDLQWESENLVRVNHEPVGGNQDAPRPGTVENGDSGAAPGRLGVGRKKGPGKQLGLFGD